MKKSDTEMGGGTSKSEDAPRSPSRRKLLLGGAVAGAAVMAGAAPNVFASAAGVAAGGNSGEKEIRLGFISPRSGSLGLFGEPDPFILAKVRKLFEPGLVLNGERYKVTIFDGDTQSSPARASQLTRTMINQHRIHLMITTSTPETVNPVSDACEAASVPSIASDCPLESFFFGRGGKMGKPSPFKWTFDFSFGIAQFGKAYLSMWDQLKTNKKVAVMYANDADGGAFRDHLAPMLEKGGYKIVDPGPYQDGTTDYSSQIALFNRENCQIFNTVPIPPDFNAFWRQAAQLHYAQKCLIPQIAKTGLFPSQVTPLGALGYNLATATFWHPVFPYKSPLTGGTSQQLTDEYQQATGRQWNQQLGVSLALFEVAVEILKRAKDPTDHADIRDVIPNLDMITTLGRVNFKDGPYPNTATTPEIGSQWVKAAPGSKWPLDMVIVDHANDPNVPIQRKLVPYHI